MKVVLDTNVFISGVFWKGPPHAILELWAKDKIQWMSERASYLFPIPLLTPLSSFLANIF